MKQSWKFKKLVEIAIVFEDGNWIESKDQSVEGVRLIQTGNVGNGFFKDRIEKARYISVDTFERLKCTEIFKGDCLISRLPDPVGRVCILPNTGEKMITAVDCTIVRFQQKIIIPEWFLFYSLSVEYHEKIKKKVTGATRQRISRKNLGFIDIPIPPLPEQQRIVAILDEAFATIDKAKANAKQNLQNAKELFESYLESVFKNKGVDWKEKALGEIAFVKSGGTPSRAKKEYWNGDIAWYSSGELNDFYTKDPERHINELAINNSNAKLFPKGSLLIGMYDTAALKMSIIDRDATFNQAIAGVKPNDKIDLAFILHSINSIKPDLLNLRRGVRQKNLSLAKIKNIPIYLPPLTTQKGIVKNLDSMAATTKKLETIYQKKIDDLEELKKSILQKAFNGELKTLEAIAV